MAEREDDRRGFASRTPVNTHPDGITYRRGFVTRHQVSGWRFLMRRIASGVALHDTRMLVEPLRTQSRAVMTGALVVITGLLGCLMFSWIRPGGVPGTEPVLADRDTAALYVRIGDTLHPVLNLTSARLIAGEAAKPRMVRGSELDSFPRGSLVGIPGAPERMVQSTSRDADWTVCDAGPASGVTVIAGAPASGGERAAVLHDDEAVLADSGAGTWLLWQGRRSRIDLADRAVTGALGIGPGAAVRPVADGLLNAVPEAPALRAPAIPGAGSPAPYALPVAAPVGAIVVSYTADGALRHYAVLPTGVQQVSPVLAAVLRNTDSFGLDQPPRLAADEISRLPVADTLDADAFPARQVELRDAGADPVTCAHWSKPDRAATSSLALLAGSTLPMADGVQAIDLVGGGSGGTAQRIAMRPGSGYLTQIVGPQPAATTAGSLFWLADTGVRYGIEGSRDGIGGSGGSGDVEGTVAALGLASPPVPVPWAVAALFAPGPTLSRDDALVARDSLGTAAVAARRIEETP
ncbi:type VII secretion protein EccB [Mycobacterium sp. MYCO198283]|nr:type VII secretion protein EccB [Mycobacterium sp. MYCO198283]MCG5432074.1 type VII secretion protein EccB [Mycobacterium sp. MYCO198283]